MNLKNHVENMQNMLDELEKIIKCIERSPEINKSGQLICSTIDRHTRFYLQTDDGKKEYLGEDKKDLIKELASKKHYEKMLETAKREREKLLRCIKILTTGRQLADIDKVFPSLHKAVQSLIGPFKVTDDGFALNWLKSNKILRNRKLLNGQYRTLKGEYVKSKSEVIIADRLTFNNVPYIYEASAVLDDWTSIRYPDFMILNKRTRKEYYWEHLGKMGDEEYAVGNQIKIEQFAKNGIILGKNLILSVECKGRPLSTEYVDTIIKEILI